MALTYTSDQITNRYTSPPPSPRSAGEVYVVPFEVSITAAPTNGILIGLAAIPGDCIPVDIVVIPTDMDEGTALLFDVGVLDTATTDLVSSSLLIDGSAAMQTGVVARMDDYECAFEPATWLAETDCEDTHEDKIIAAKIMAAPNTGATGTIRGQVFYRAAYNGV